MPTATQTEPEVEMDSYTVVASAVTLETAEIDPQTKRPIIVRALYGETFRAPVNNPSVITLLGMKSLLPTSKFKGQHTTARTILLAYADDADPVVLVEDVKPIAAPVPKDVDPEALTVEDLKE